MTTYSTVTGVGHGGQIIQAIEGNHTSGQKVSYDTSTQSAAIGTDGHVVVEMIATTDCYINIGSNPTATANAGSTYLPAGERLYRVVAGGTKIAAVKATTAGALYIIPAKMT